MASTPSGRRRRALALWAAGLVAVWVLCSFAPVAAAADPVIAVAGDIACDPTHPNEPRNPGGYVSSSAACHEQSTSDLLVDTGLTAVLPLGDIQYEHGTLSQFNAVYDPTWGRVKAITRPAVGNHEYATPGAQGYFDYFNDSVAPARAGPRGRGYYSFDVGGWHLIALNSNCSQLAPPDGCAAGSTQEQWLRSDLAAHPNQCILAYWHHPRFSSSTLAYPTGTTALWQALYEARADLVLNGHAHNYERFAPQDPAGRPDASGIREFVVGTGGKDHHGFGATAANSEVRNNDTFGVLRLTLHPTSYDWQFVPEAGASFSDASPTSQPCHAFPSPPSAAGGQSPATVTGGAVFAPATALAPRAPEIRSLSLTPRRFRVGSAATAFSARVGRGTVVRYVLTAPATVRLTISRLPGRLWRRSCRAPTRSLRRARRCSRTMRVGTLTRRARQGVNRTAFSGRLGRRPLRAGRYVVEVRATGVSGKQGRPRKLTFTVLGG